MVLLSRRDVGCETLWPCRASFIHPGATAALPGRDAAVPACNLSGPALSWGAGQGGGGALASGHVSATAGGPASPLWDVVAAALLRRSRSTRCGPATGLSPAAGVVACFAVATLSLAARRRAPLVALAFCAGALTVQTVALGEAPVAGGFLAVLVLTYSVAAHSRIRLRWSACSSCASPSSWSPRRAARRGRRRCGGNRGLFALVWGAGRVVRELRQRGAWWERRADDLERSRQERVTAAVAEERQRIARELHDVVAHSVSVMVLHAGAARQYVALDPPRATQPLLLVEEVGRQALEELQRLLQVLRDSDEEPSSIVGLGDVDQLVEHVRQAGLGVRLDVRGTPQPLAPGLDLTAYRILQEALTNVLKHAPQAHPEVSIEYGERELVLSVLDEGSRVGSSATVVGGNGLVGMRERVQLDGGSLDVGPREAGGFAVRARIPLGHSRAL